MARASNLTMCSFCGKSHAEVRKLIAGPGVYICDNCINVCKGILDKELNEDAGAKPPVCVFRSPPRSGDSSISMSLARRPRKKCLRLRFTIISSGSCRRAEARICQWIHTRM